MRPVNSNVSQSVPDPFEGSRCKEFDGPVSLTALHQNDKGEYHCEDGPALSWSNGKQEWYYQGERHRLNGPAIIEPDGHQEWWLHGQKFPKPGEGIIPAISLNLTHQASSIIKRQIHDPVSQSIRCFETLKREKGGKGDR